MHNKPHSKETKRKISETIKRQFKEGRKSWCKGKKFPFKIVWNKGTKGVMKSNSGSFKKGCMVNFRNGRIKTFRGYIMIYKPEHPFCNKQKYYPEHRLIVENIIGRYLDPKEKIHHLNGDKSDNNSENLLLCKVSGYHKIIHYKMEELVYGLIKKGKVFFDKEKEIFVLKENL